MINDSGPTDLAAAARPASDAVARRDCHAKATTTVVETVADATNTSPRELPPLADAIDPDALDALFAPDAPADRTLTFTYADYHVTVVGSGRIVLDPTDD